MVGGDQVVGYQSTGIDAFHAQHARVGAQLRMQLGAAHIHAHHRHRAMLQQAVGKTAGGLAHIQARKTGHVQPQVLECSFKLQAAARHIACLGVIEQPHRGVLGHVVTVFCHPFPGVALLPFHPVGNQALGLGTGAGKLDLNQQLVNAHSVGHQYR